MALSPTATLQDTQPSLEWSTAQAVSDGLAGTTPVMTPSSNGASPTSAALEGDRYSPSAGSHPTTHRKTRSFVIDQGGNSPSTSRGMVTEGMLDEELYEWLVQHDTDDSMPKDVYKGFKDRVSHMLSSRRRGLVKAETTLNKSRTWSAAPSQGFHRRYQLKEGSARDERVWSTELGAVLDANFDDRFLRSDVMSGRVTEFLYAAIGDRYRESCISSGRHLNKLGRLAREASRVWK